MGNMDIAPDLILGVKGLTKHFPIERGFLKKVVGHVRAVSDVSFSVKKGETLGLVGESGCGKTTTARMIMKAVEPTAGSVRFRTDQGVVDMAKVDRRELKAIRRDMQMIFQDPYSSLNPRMTVQEIVGEPLGNYGYSAEESKKRVQELLALVGLNPKYLSRYPHAFSGGQRQRLGIARALALDPSLIVCDEPVSALDVSVQAQILNLLKDLQDELGLTYLFIAHDLSVIRHICDRVAVMYFGRIVELADTDILFNNPLHPYTKALLRAVPDPDPREEWLGGVICGEIPDPTKEMVGCSFPPRCAYVQKQCEQICPQLIDVATQGEQTHQVACHLVAEATGLRKEA